MILLHSLLKPLKEYRIELFFGPLLKLIEAIIEVFLPFFIAYLIDQRDALTMHDFVIKGCFILFLVLCGFLCATAAQYLAAKTSQGYGRKVRSLLFSHILSLSISQQKAIGSSVFVNRITSDVTNLETAVAMFIRLVIRVPFICLASFMMCFTFNVELSFILLVGILLLSVFLFVILPIASKLFQKSNQKLDELVLKVKEIVTNIRVIHSFSSEEREEKKFAIQNDETSRYIKKANFFSGLLNPVSTLILDGIILFFLFLGRGKITLGNLSTGELVAMINYVSQILAALLVLSNLVTIYTRCFASSKRIKEILAISSEKKEGNEEAFDGSRQEAITMQDISFHYLTTQTSFLDNLSLSIQKGEKVGIVGQTGSGKSTLLDLISGNLSPISGRIEIFHKPLASFSSAFLKKTICAIEQKANFLTSTISNTIKMGRKASEEELKAALSLAKADGFVAELKEKEESLLTNNASQLSGGQKQRIALARAFIGEASILLLDDPTSALDFKTEAEVLQNLFSYVSEKKKTLVLTSQKISAVSCCDRILVLEEGKIVAEGTHETLLKTCPLYRKMYELQTKGVLLDEKE